MAGLRNWRTFDVLLLAGIAGLVGYRLGLMHPTVAGVLRFGAEGHGAPPGWGDARPLPPPGGVVAVVPVVAQAPLVLVPTDARSSVRMMMRDERWDQLPTLSAMDLRDSGDAFDIRLSLSGFGLEDILLRIDGSVLSVQAQHQHAGGAATFNVIRRILLPVAVNRDQPPHCGLTNGVLHIHVAKATPPPSAP